MSSFPTKESPSLQNICKKGDLNIITVKDNDELDLIGYTFKVMHTPGHTRGSVCYSYGNKLLSGDTLFNMSAGRTDFPTGNSKDMRLSLNKIINKLSRSSLLFDILSAETNLFISSSKLISKS